MSGICDFCEIFHSGPCSHPGRIKLINLKQQLQTAHEALEADTAIARRRGIEMKCEACGEEFEREHESAKVHFLNHIAGSLRTLENRQLEGK